MKCRPIFVFLLILVLFLFPQIMLCSDDLTTDEECVEQLGGQVEVEEGALGGR